MLAAVTILSLSPPFSLYLSIHIVYTTDRINWYRYLDINVVRGVAAQLVACQYVPIDYLARTQQLTDPVVTYVVGKFYLEHSGLSSEQQQTSYGRFLHFWTCNFLFSLFSLSLALTLIPSLRRRLPQLSPLHNDGPDYPVRAPRRLVRADVYEPRYRRAFADRSPRQGQLG